MTTPQHTEGLHHDLRTLSRRGLLGVLGGLGAAGLAGCAAAAGATGASTSGPTTSAAGGLAEIPEETAGPYPGDGSNGVNTLDAEGIVRQDLTRSFGASSGEVTGVPLTVNLTVLTGEALAPVANGAVYLWHCTPDGSYSLYSSGHTDQNYLRGVQPTDAHGNVSFTTVFPGCYAGRWPHIHFEVFSSVAEATSGSGQIVQTSQLALPQSVCEEVYRESAYAGSTANLSRLSLQSDNVFGEDGGVLQLASVTGSVSQGYTAALTMRVEPGGGVSATGGSRGPMGPGGQPPGAPR
ncbi:hypothetical protein GCM10027418_15740 [Mariniluteicoccus endophyticus]